MLSSTIDSLLDSSHDELISQLRNKDSSLYHKFTELVLSVSQRSSSTQVTTTYTLGLNPVKDVLELTQGEDTYVTLGSSNYVLLFNTGGIGVRGSLNGEAADGYVALSPQDFLHYLDCGNPSRSVAILHKVIIALEELRGMVS